jgi:hypothetical protein
LEKGDLGDGGSSGKVDSGDGKSSGKVDSGDGKPSGKGDSGGYESAESLPVSPIMLASIEENVGMIIVVRNGNVEFVHDVEIGTEGLHDTRSVRELAREIRSSVKYYHTNVSSEEEIDRIFLFRDDASKMDILGGLEGQLGAPIPIIEPPPPVNWREPGGKQPFGFCRRRSRDANGNGQERRIHQPPGVIQESWSRELKEESTAVPGDISFPGAGGDGS